MAGVVVVFVIITAGVVGLWTIGALLAVLVHREVGHLRRRVAALEAERRTDEVETLEAERRTDEVAPPAPQAPAPKAPAPQAPARPAVVPEPIVASEPAEVVPVDIAPDEPLPESAPAASEPPSETWEMAVGSNWLNKVGVVVFVIGLALLVSYSFRQLGPAGRVAVGYGVSLTMLGAGIALARRGSFRTYAYGLIAGGWAGAYFTTYAMRAVDAARIIDNDLLAASLLTAVAGGMVVHGLRYRSQTVTVLTFVVTYATLAITPLTWFAMAAALPLAIVIMAVGQRLAWTAVSALGIGATYALFALRGIGAAGAPFDPSSLAPWMLLAVFWMTFEAADLLGLRTRPPDAASNHPMFALNSIGLVGSMLLALPVGDPARLSVFLAALSVAYLASAVLRRRLIGRLDAAAEADAPTASFTTFHAAVAGALFLMMWSTAARFDDAQLSITWLVLGQLTVAGGLALSDARLRQVGGVGVALAVVHAVIRVLVDGGNRIESLHVDSTTLVLMLVAVVCYGNREWIRARRSSATDLTSAYSWTATALLALAALVELEPAHLGVAWMALAAALLEAGIRRAPEYRLQAFALGLTGALTAAAYFSETPRPAPEVWAALPLAMALAWLATFRLARPAAPASPSARALLAAAIASTAGVVLIAEFEWHVLPEVLRAPALALTGFGLFSAGAARRLALPRWQGYAVLVLGVMAGLDGVVGPNTTGPVVAVCAAAALLYVTSLRARPPVGHGDAERLAIAGLSILATVVLTVVAAAELRQSLITAGWGVLGLLLLSVGVGFRDRLMRLSGLSVLALCVLKLFFYDLRELEPLPRIASFMVLGALLLLVSWGYTRLKPRL